MLVTETNTTFRDWDQVQQSIWSQLNEKWPYFNFENIGSLDFYVTEYAKKKPITPRNMSNDKFLDMVNVYIDSQVLDLSPLIENNIELKKEVECFEKFCDIALEWYMGRGKNSFCWYFKPLRRDMSDIISGINKMFGAEIPKHYEIISIFDPNSDTINRKIEEVLYEKFKIFAQKWTPFIEEESKKTNNALQTILENL